MKRKKDVQLQVEPRVQGWGAPPVPFPVKPESLEGTPPPTPPVELRGAGEGRGPRWAVCTACASLVNTGARVSAFLHRPSHLRVCPSSAPGFLPSAQAPKPPPSRAAPLVSRAWTFYSSFLPRLISLSGAPPDLTWGCSRASLLKPRLCFDLELQARLPLTQGSQLGRRCVLPVTISQRALSIFSASQTPCCTPGMPELKTGGVPDALNWPAASVAVNAPGTPCAGCSAKPVTWTVASSNGREHLLWQSLAHYGL